MADSTIPVIRALLSYSHCKINALDNNLRTALHWAAVLGRAPVCSLLLDCGAKHDSADGYGATPLHYAVKAGSIEAVETLMRRPEVLHIVDNNVPISTYPFFP